MVVLVFLYIRINHNSFHDYLHVLYVVLCCVAAVVSVVGYFQHVTECTLSLHVYLAV